jgi:DNA topoisomerase IA
MRNLLIVESAGKIKKLKTILGSDWDVKASIGHIRQLANDGDGALGFDLGADTIDCRYIPRDERAKQCDRNRFAVSAIYFLSDTASDNFDCLYARSKTQPATTKAEKLVRGKSRPTSFK